MPTPPQQLDVRAPTGRDLDLRLFPGASLTSLANGIAEGATLLAVLALPLFFSVLTGAGYEVDKAVLIRPLAAVAAVGWFVGSAPRMGLSRSGRLIDIFAALFFSLFLVSSLLSVAPEESILGTYGRQEGLWTALSYAVFFLVATTRFRSRAQVERLISVVLLGSVPAIFYGLLQQAGIDPVPASGDPSSLAFPVWSTFGQHVFFASYLVMIIPFVGVRTWESWTRPLEGNLDDLLLPALAVSLVVTSFLVFLALGISFTALFSLMPALLAEYTLVALYLHSRQVPSLVTRTGYTALLAASITVLLFTGARGAWLGFLAGVPVFAGLLAWRLHRPRIWQTVAGVTAVVGVFLVLLNIPGGPLQPLRQVHGLSRLADITGGGGTEGSAQGRVLIWTGVVHLLGSTPSVGGNWGGPLRDVVGYGPDTLLYSFQAVFPLQLRQVTAEVWTWDRAHNIFLNYAADLGIFGLLIVVVLLVLYFKRLVDVAGSRAYDLIPIALATAMVSHLVDGFFGIEMAVTLLLFWLFLGLTSGLPWDDESVPLDTRSLPPAIGVLGGLTVLAAVVVIALQPVWGPGSLSTLTLIALLVGIAVISWALRSPRSAGRQRSRLWLIAPALGLLVALSAQWAVWDAGMSERIGTSNLDAGLAQAALGPLQDAVTADGLEPHYLVNLSTAYLALGSLRTSSSDTGAAIGGDAYRSLRPAAVAGLGRDQIFTLSEQSARAALDQTPIDPDLWSDLGVLYRTWGRTSQALAAFSRAEALSRQNPRYIVEEALTAEQGGRKVEALHLARQALQLDTRYWYSWYALALADEGLGRRAAASTAASSALTYSTVAYPPADAGTITQLRDIAQNG